MSLTSIQCLLKLKKFIRVDSIGTRDFIIVLNYYFINYTYYITLY